MDWNTLRSSKLAVLAVLLTACPASGDVTVESATESGSSTQGPDTAQTATTPPTSSSTTVSTEPDPETDTMPATTGSTSDGETTTGESTTGETTTGETTTGETTTGGETTGEVGPIACQGERLEVAGFLRYDGPPTAAELYGAEVPLVSANGGSASASAADGLGQHDPQAGGGFIMDPDGGGTGIECDVWLQDCPVGEKCNAWANDGGNAWNALRCVPVVPDPDPVGEACTVEGSGVSGVDTCDHGAMCWNVEEGTEDGTCVELCQGSEASPTCATPQTSCVISNEGVLILCLPICNPLADECGDGNGCYPINDSFHCAPDASGEMGGAGDPCEFINACDDGLICSQAENVPGCVGAGSCCTSTCFDGEDRTCADGQSCVPFYDPPESAPDMCLEDVGVCIGR